MNPLNSSSSSASFTVDKQEEEGQHVICKLASGFGDVTNVTVDEETATEMDTCAELQGNGNKYFVKTRNGGSVELLVQFGSSTSSVSSGYRTAARLSRMQMLDMSGEQEVFTLSHLVEGTPQSRSFAML